MVNSRLPTHGQWKRAPYHSQANPVERSNCTLKTMIARFVKTDHKNWDQHLHELRHAMNTAVQSSTRVTPAFFNFGRHPESTKSLRRAGETKRPKTRLPPEVWVDRVKRLDALRDMVVRNIERAHQRQVVYYNRGHKDVRFQVGEMVTRKTHILSNAANKISSKLAPVGRVLMKLSRSNPQTFTSSKWNRGAKTLKCMFQN